MGVSSVVVFALLGMITATDETTDAEKILALPGK